MANIITLIACGVVTLFLLISIAFAGDHLLLPAVAMILTVLVGGLCLYVANGMLTSRRAIEKEWEAKNPE